METSVSLPATVSQRNASQGTGQEEEAGFEACTGLCSTWESSQVSAQSYFWQAKPSGLSSPSFRGIFTSPQLSLWLSPEPALTFAARSERWAAGR